MKLHRKARPCTCCQIRFNPIDLTYDDESKPQKQCTRCLDHLADPEKKKSDHAEMHLEAYQNEAESCEDLRNRLKHAHETIDALKKTSYRRRRVLIEIDKLLSNDQLDADENTETWLLDKVYQLVSDWRDSDGGRP